MSILLFNEQAHMYVYMTLLRDRGAWIYDNKLLAFQPSMPLTLPLC